MHRRIAVLTALVIASCCGMARAGTPGINLSWSGCALDTASSQRCYTCDGKAGALFVLQGSFRPANAVGDFASTSSIVDVQFDQGATVIPDFWRMGVADCDAQAVAIGDPVTTGGCALPNIFTPGSAGGGVAVSYPTAYRVRFRIDWATTGTTLVRLTAGQLYPAFALAIDADHGVASGCAGCAISASIQIQEIEVFWFTSGENESIFVADQRNWVLWQAAPGAPCRTVATRPTTWGAVKALYR
jgi:hypothetical protein